MITIQDGSSSLLECHWTSCYLMLLSLVATSCYVYIQVIQCVWSIIATKMQWFLFIDFPSSDPSTLTNNICQVDNRPDGSLCFWSLVMKSSQSRKVFQWNSITKVSVRCHVRCLRMKFLKNLPAKDFSPVPNLCICFIFFNRVPGKQLYRHL